MHNQTTIILGPTAVGKTGYAINYAKENNCEIISADSMQVYVGMDIGTAKPTEAERAGIPHHLIDIRCPDEEWTVSDFVKETNKLIPKIIERGKTPLIVGGTGLYLWAFVNGFSFPMVPRDDQIRKQLESEPLTTLYSLLSKIDPVSAQKIHQNDKKRVIRALEVFEITGKPISKLQGKGTANFPGPPGRAFAGSLIGLNAPREKLYQKINERVDKMFEKGLVDEVGFLLKKGYDRTLQSMQALGYKEVIRFLLAELTYDETVELLKKKTRNFARRQMVWFRRFDNVKWIEV
ncbi:tRNA (adenosine(37)-N6)-dimethylallyltransferase MiaA [Candidatus Margulisiibacteriota bacterium]